MKVYFVGGELLGCVYVRCLLPMWHNGWGGNRVSLKKPMKSVKQMKEELLNADIVVFHRPEQVEHHGLGMALRAAGKKIVFDNDDTFQLDKYHPFFCIDSENFQKNIEYKNNIVNNFILNSDLVTCTTEYLKNEYSKINKNVVVLPNYIDPMDWPKPLPKNESGKVRIGIVGSTGYAHDYEVIKGIIEKLDERDDVTIVLFGFNSFSKDKPDSSDSKEQELINKVLEKEIEFWTARKNVEKLHWVSMDKYYKALNDLKIDFVLIPRRENNFNKAKSNIKFLEMAMVETPVIASKFSDGSSPYEKDIDGTNGLLVNNTEEEWNEAIEFMINNKKERQEMGKKAREYVLANYNIKDHAYKWAEAYKKLLQ